MLDMQHPHESTPEQDPTLMKTTGTQVQCKRPTSFHYKLHFLYCFLAARMGVCIQSFPAVLETNHPSSSLKFVP